MAREDLDITFKQSKKGRIPGSRHGWNVCHRRGHGRTFLDMQMLIPSAFLLPPWERVATYREQRTGRFLAILPVSSALPVIICIIKNKLVKRNKYYVKRNRYGRLRMV